jgi:hypothetical protein
MDIGEGAASTIERSRRHVERRFVDENRIRSRARGGDRNRFQEPAQRGREPVEGGVAARVDRSWRDRYLSLLAR